MPNQKGSGQADRASQAQTGVRGSHLDPCQRVAVDRMLQFEICCALECLADGLPDIKDLRLARALISVLEPSWLEHVSFQDEALFPILLRRHHASRELAQSLERLRRDHIEIGDRNREVNEQIELLLAGDAPDPEMFGYLLRSAFDSRRRHIESELVLVEAYLPSMLTPAERTIVDVWHSTRPQPPFPIGLLLEIRH